MDAYPAFATDLTEQIIRDEVILEIKSVERFNPVFLAQMLTYLRITGLHVGLILNFNRSVMKDGVRRVSLKESLSL